MLHTAYNFSFISSLNSACVMFFFLTSEAKLKVDIGGIHHRVRSWFRSFGLIVEFELATRITSYSYRLFGFDTQSC